MIDVSNAWKDIHQRFLLPETFVEIDCTISEIGAQESATMSGTQEESFSVVDGVLDETPKTVKYATMEHNLWALDGTRAILPNSGDRADVGYVSNIESTGSVTLSLSEVRTIASSGITITWSSMYGEYPKVFTVTAKNGDTIVAETTVTDNEDVVSVVFLELVNYDSIVITVHSWAMPGRRVRIEKVVIGHVLTLTKSDILSFTHEQSGDLLSGEIPKYSIEFTLDNSDGRWNPDNPTGMERYLSERQKLVVRYGMDVNGATEWIKGGTFYLSEWDAPSNGLEARFVARDIFDFMLDEEQWNSGSKTLSQWVGLATSNIPSDSTVVIDSTMNNLSAEYSPSYTTDRVSTNAEIVQKSANAGCCILRYDRDGVLYVEKFEDNMRDYVIPLSLSYSYPEITLSKPLKSVSVDYGAETPYTLSVSSDGVQQTMSNDFIGSSTNAETVATWVSDVLKARKTIRGEFRVDPRLDLYDVVQVEDRYWKKLTVAITNIKYTYSGSFRGSFAGRVLEVDT